MNFDPTSASGCSAHAGGLPALQFSNALTGSDGGHRGVRRLRLTGRQAPVLLAMLRYVLLVRRTISLGVSPYDDTLVACSGKEHQRQHWKVHKPGCTDLLRQSRQLPQVTVATQVKSSAFLASPRGRLSRASSLALLLGKQGRKSGWHSRAASVLCVC